MATNKTVCQCVYNEFDCKFLAAACVWDVDAVIDDILSKFCLYVANIFDCSSSLLLMFCRASKSLF